MRYSVVGVEDSLIFWIEHELRHLCLNPVFRPVGDIFERETVSTAAERKIPRTKLDILLKHVYIRIPDRGYQSFFDAVKEHYLDVVKFAYAEHMDFNSLQLYKFNSAFLWFFEDYLEHRSGLPAYEQIMMCALAKDLKARTDADQKKNEQGRDAVGL